MATNPNPSCPSDTYAHGTPYPEVFDAERKLREVAEETLNRRLLEIEDRLCICEGQTTFAKEYPELRKAYDKFRYEEAKMKTMEILKNSK